MAKQHKFMPGDRIAYSVKWFKAGNITGYLLHLRGTVMSVKPFGAHDSVVIKWDDDFAQSEYYDDGYGRVTLPNLTLISWLGLIRKIAGLSAAEAEAY